MSGQPIGCACDPDANYRCDAHAEAELASIYNALAESVLEMSDEEIEAEIRDEGLDPGEVAAHVRQVMREAIERSTSMGHPPRKGSR